jgi:hypothetical protein
VSWAHVEAAGAKNNKPVRTTRAKQVFRVISFSFSTVESQRKCHTEKGIIGFITVCPSCLSTATNASDCKPGDRLRTVVHGSCSLIHAVTSLIDQTQRSLVRLIKDTARLPAIALNLSSTLLQYPRDHALGRWQNGLKPASILETWSFPGCIPTVTFRAHAPMDMQMPGPGRQTLC